MATYVLVHGAWAGAHGFRTVRRLLQAQGHEVFTPSLTGIGERVHLVSPQVTLSTHIADVVNAVLYEDLRDIVLLGFSYGGAVVSGALDHIGDRVRELVFLDAFVPDDGDTVAGSARARSTAIELGAAWLVQPVPRTYEDAAEGEWQSARRVPHPVRCFTEPVHLSIPLEEQPFGLTYIKATADAEDAPGAASFWAAANRAKDSGGRWRYREVATNHMVAANRPQELAAILLELA